MGNETWESLSEAVRQHKLRVHVLDCQQHMRHIFLQHMSRRQVQPKYSLRRTHQAHTVRDAPTFCLYLQRLQADHVKAELADDLSKFASWETMKISFDQLLRAVYNEFHHGGKYFKGKGVEFT